MQRYRITSAFLFPTALKMMMKSVTDPRSRYTLHLRSMMSAGESVGATVFAWCREALGLTVNEMFGQTEMNYIVGNSHLKWPARPGSMGRPYPGHRVAVIDDDGNAVPPGIVGEVAINRRDIHWSLDPIFFLEYWRTPPRHATSSPASGRAPGTWRVPTRTAISGTRAAPTTSSRPPATGSARARSRTGLVKHRAVANVAVVPKPDAERGAVVKAYVVGAAGFEGSPALVDELQKHVRGQLAPYEYPKEIEFIAELPMTTTGKVQRRVLREQEAKRAARAEDD